jgi:hypothetical protein
MFSLKTLISLFEKEGDKIMANKSPAKVKATTVQQACIVVNDLQKTMDAFWNILGIGPWVVFDFESLKIQDFCYNGKPGWGRYKGALTQVGPLEIELFETLEGVSVYQDWIDEQGEGLHHMKFLVEDLDVDRVNEEMERHGFPRIMGGHFGPEFKNQFSYFDMRKALRCIWETSSRKQATVRRENPNTVSTSRVKVTEIKQVGIVVRDVYETAKNYWNLLGIGPWEIREWESHILYQRTYHGNPSWAKERLAHAYVGDLELELCQVVEGDSIYQDWINQHGEGLHHLTFLCDDVDEVSKTLTNQGFVNLQSGRFGNPEEKPFGYNYIDIPPLHCIWKPVHRPKALPVEPVAHVP